MSAVTTLLRADPDLDEHPAAPPTARLSRWWLAGALAVALVLCLVQSPGVIIDDTKLPLIMAPLAFMQNSLHLWNPQQYSGSVQSLSYGYLFPMGPFFALAQALHVPVWCAERVWLALLLTTAFWGVVRLAEALRLGGPAGQVLGGIAYAFAPITVTWAATSAALLVVALFPWLIVPLVHGSRSGSPRRAAAASGLALALMGGVNVAGVAATLPVAIIWLATRRPGPRRRALIGWWVVAVVLACFWWMAALLIQSRYGYNYLPYTETPAITTGTTSLFDALQGASYWTNYFTLGGPLLPGAHLLVSSPLPILCTAGVSALGIAGLTRRGIPERLFLVASLSVGVVAIAIGYAGSLSGPFSSGVRDLLAGPLAPFRNVSKFSPVVTLPVALGLAWLMSSIRWHPRALQGRLVSGLPLGRVAVGLLAVLALIGASAPFWQAETYPPGGFARIPGYWYAAARWLDAHQDHQTALLVPGASFAEYTWGRPLDEPLSVLLNSSWTVRSLIPLGSDGNDGVLDAVESSLDDGVPAPGMAGYLSRAGIDYVVERNDLDLNLTGAPPPAQVHQVLTQTPGLREVAAFGPVVSAHQLSGSSLPVYDTSLADMRLHAVEIYQVLPPARVVRTYPARDPVLLSGSSGSLLPLVASGTVTDRATILSGDPNGAATAALAPGATWADTDGNQRRDVSFGGIRQNVSYVLGPGQRTNAVSRHVPENFAVVAGTSHETVEAPLNAASVAASSYGSTTLVLEPSEGPAAAFDGDPVTAWVANAAHSSVGQWVQINFGREIRLSTISIVPLYSGTLRPTVRAVTISTQRGSVTRPIFPADVATKVRTPPGSSSWLRVTIRAVVHAHPPSGPFFTLGAGITDITIPGVHFLPALQVPADEVGQFSRAGANAPVYSFSSPLDNANIGLGAHNDDEPWMVRRFTVPRATTVTVTGAATPLQGPLLTAMIPDALSIVGVTASSTLGDLPRFSPQNLSGGSTNPWIAGYGDFNPAITLRWPQSVSVGSLVLDPAPSASAPRRVEISSPAGKRIVDVPRAGGTLTFAPMVTNTLTIHFSKLEAPAHAALFPMPVGLDRVSVPALGPVPVYRTPATTSFSLACGQGPTLLLDGHPLPTSLTGTLEDLEDLRPLQLTVCAPHGVALAAGPHVLIGSGDGAAFKITSLTMAPVAAAPHASARSATIVGTWSPQQRTVRMGPGAASYLVVAQNFNAGWTATFAGHTLEPVRVDGWQQAWLVPGGRGGVVTMTFTPDTIYRTVLVLGAVLLVALVLLVLPFGRRRDEPAVEERLPLPRWALAIGATVVMVAVVGPLALLLVPAWLIGRRWGATALAAVAGLALAVAGLAVAVVGGGVPGSSTGAFGPVAQAATAVSLAAVLAALILSGRRWQKGAPSGPEPGRVEPAANAGTDSETKMSALVLRSTWAARVGSVDRFRTPRPLRPPRSDRLAGTPWGIPQAPPPSIPRAARS